MTTAHQPATATLSGREIALMRRQAMAQHGKSGLSLVRPVALIAPAPGPEPRREAVPQDGAAAGWQGAATPAAPRRAALERRLALSRVGKAALPGRAARQPGPGMMNGAREAAVPAACGCGCAGVLESADGAAIESAAGAVIESAAVAEVATGDAAARRVVQPVGRALARARRAALAQDGKSGLRRVEQAARIAVALPGQDWQMAIAKGASGRQVAMQHRKARALAGGGGANKAAPSRPSGPVRPRPALMQAPPKVEQGHTLSGAAITGTMVERSRKVTGNEPGSCRAVTGTEYIGSEQYGDLCAVTVAAGAAKVRVSRTARDQSVTGTEIGYARQMTGNEAGACHAVTGTDYLPADMYEKFCPPRSPETLGKGGVMTGTRVGAGTPGGRSAPVTGGESGADRAITGTVYAVQSPDTAPAKSALSHTYAALPLTGSAIGGGAPKVSAIGDTAVGGTASGRAPKVTGDEPGSCRAVTGSQYLSAEHFKEVCRSEVPPPVRRTGVMSTPDGQTVTGSAVGRARQVTGDEAGACRAVTGSQYFNAKDFGVLCTTVTGAPAAAPKGQARDRAVIAAAMVTGDRPGAGGAGTTGDERGACIAVTGVPYVGADNRAGFCAALPEMAGRSPGRQGAAMPEPGPAPVDFSIRSPARAAWDAAAGGRAGDSVVTGTAYGGAERITGPGNKAGGLITGTPEFRHHDFTAMPRGDAAPGERVRMGTAQRLSGEAHVHERVTGDAWQAQSRVSGTEGRSSVMRNPSRRGQPRGEGVDARGGRAADMPAAGAILVTGSSGNTGRGAVVTVSGGARA
ncbi:CsoS2 family carboxysome shell protein [Acidiphilium sp.]|uniref:CsoS2 family carboxysome shell protein n=1 Tax=Acidiphilium sp. TaxID=527 RepID=UPI003D028BB3